MIDAPTKEFDLELITAVAIRTIREVQSQIARLVSQDPGKNLEPAQVGRSGKPLLVVDLVAERNCMDKLRQRLPYDLNPLGEESLTDENLNLRKERRLVVLMDMVDGTDLLERSLSNWCSAIVFYYPAEERILAAFVGLHEEGVYFATETQERPRKYLFHAPHPNRPSNAAANVTNAQETTSDLPEHKMLNLTGPSSVTDIASASIAFYGQQVSHLGPVRHSDFFRRLEQLDRKCRRRRPPTKLATRVYNLAGNPMMMRLIDGNKRIDAVFELKGQAPHDVVPGAYIAQKAGAVFSDLNGESVPLHELLLTPAKSKVRYVLASTEPLAEELRAHLALRRKPVKRKLS